MGIDQFTDLKSFANLWVNAFGAFIKRITKVGKGQNCVSGEVMERTEDV
jgi:hypothetical protein